MTSTLAWAWPSAPAYSLVGALYWRRKDFFALPGRAPWEQVGYFSFKCLFAPQNFSVSHLTLEAVVSYRKLRSTEILSCSDLSVEQAIYSVFNAQPCYAISSSLMTKWGGKVYYAYSLAHGETVCFIAVRNCKKLCYGSSCSSDIILWITSQHVKFNSVAV